MAELARGCYHYSCDEQAQPVTEPWQLRREATDLLLRGQRLLKDECLLDIEARYRHGRCEDLRLHWKPGNPQAQREFHYRYNGQALRWRQSGAEPVEWLIEDALLYPLLRAATGPLLQHLLRRPRDILLPCLRDPSDSSQFLSPLKSTRHATLQGIAADGTRHLRYFGGEYGEAGCDCWLNPQSLVSRYTWASPEGTWAVTLEDLWLAPQFAGFD